MSTEKDSMLRVRLTQRQSDELDAIIDELQAQMPEASVTTSSIARYALEKYVSDHIAKRDGTKIFIEVSTENATEEEIKNLYDLLSKLSVVKLNYPVSGKKMPHLFTNFHL